MKPEEWCVRSEARCEGEVRESCPSGNSLKHRLALLPVGPSRRVCKSNVDGGVVCEEVEVSYKIMQILYHVQLCAVQK